MSATLPYRWVYFYGEDNPDDRMVFYLAEGDDGKAIFRDFDWSYPLGVHLEDVTVADLPVVRHQPGVRITIGPLEHATGETSEIAFRHLWSNLIRERQKYVPQGALVE